MRHFRLSYSKNLESLFHLIRYRIRDRRTDVITVDALAHDVSRVKTTQWHSCGVLAGRGQRPQLCSPKHFGLWKKMFLVEKFVPKMQHLAFLTPILGEIMDKIEIWSNLIISSVEKLQLRVPPTFFIYDAPVFFFIHYWIIASIVQTSNLHSPLGSSSQLSTRLHSWNLGVLLLSRGRERKSGKGEETGREKRTGGEGRGGKKDKGKPSSPHSIHISGYATEPAVK